MFGLSNSGGSLPAKCCTYSVNSASVLLGFDPNKNFIPQFNSEVQHLAPAESGGYPKFYETILQAPVVGRT